jgi:macrolide transport system ATP-binding/permease protein
MSWLRRLFARKRMEKDLDKELRFHFESQVADKVRSGISESEARRLTRLEFGGIDQIKEDCRESRGTLWLESTLQDIRYGLRMLRKSSGFTIVAVLTLALGIGANAVVFSLLDTLVLRPLNVPGGENIYQIERGKDGDPTQSYPDYLDLRDRNHDFEGMAAAEMAPAALDSDGTPVPIWLYTASGNYFDVLGIHPYLGRFFHTTDEHGPNSAPYIVLSYAYWRSHFQGDSGVVGRTVRLNKFEYTVLGVAPPKVRGTELFFAPDLWAPIVNQQQIEGYSSLDQRGNRGREVIGRLKAGVTPAQATADLNTIAASLAKAYPKDDDGIGFKLGRPGLAGDMLGKPVRAFVAGLMLLAGLILLAACANLGGMFAARAADHMREVALRLALGSSRGRVLRQLLTEALLISLAGGVLGIAGSVVLLHALSAWQPVPSFPINLDLHADLRTYAVALLLTVLSGLLFGMVPVQKVLKADPFQGIKSGATGWERSRRITLRDILLAVQIAVCAVLVTSSLVAVRGMIRSLHSNFGFDPQKVLQVNTDLDMAGYHGDQAAAMQRRMLETIEGVPGVTAAAYASRIPLNVGWSANTVFRDSVTDYRMSNAAADAMEYGVSPGYFRAAGTSLLQGRAFTWDDNKSSPRVAVVNREFARKLFGAATNAVGHYFKIWGGTRVQVIGIVEDGKYKTLSEDPQPAMFMPILQSPSTWTWIIVRSNRNAQNLSPELEERLHALDSGLPITIATWDSELGTALLAARAASLALGVLGGLGVMLAITGIFGMAAYTVSKRLRELGIRIALGAQRKEVLMAALGRVLRLLTLGSVAGLVLGVAATRLLSYIVYQATPRDPVVLGGVLLSMMIVGLIAAWIPAQRALGADPLILLREE